MPYDTGNNENVELLLRTKRLLIEQGWRQYTFCSDATNDAGPFCLAGAAIVADLAGQVNFTSARAAKVGDRLAELLNFSDGADLFKWNDAPTRTAEEVFARLDEAVTRELER